MTSLKEQINAAIGAHGLWKGKLRMAIESGKSELPVAAIRDDHRCAFGAWLHGGALQAGIKDWDRYHSCVDLHKQFHAAAADVAELAVAGKKREATEAMTTSGRFGRLSAELTNNMLAWLGREGN